MTIADRSGGTSGRRCSTASGVSERCFTSIAGVLDAFGIPAAHVVGVSAGGALAQLFALDFPGRVRSLALISTSSALPSGRELQACCSSSTLSVMFEITSLLTLAP